MPQSNSPSIRIGSTAVLLAALLFLAVPAQQAHAQYAETVPYTFSGGADGAAPSAGLIFDSKGNLYGVTDEGGSGNNCGIDVGCGTLYRLSASGRLTLLHSFDLNDGAYPLGEVLRTKRALFGTTKYGGKHSGGTVWKYAP